MMGAESLLSPSRTLSRSLLLLQSYLPKVLPPTLTLSGIRTLDKVGINARSPSPCFIARVLSAYNTRTLSFSRSSLRMVSFLPMSSSTSQLTLTYRSASLFYREWKPRRSAYLYIFLSTLMEDRWMDLLTILAAPWPRTP
jgi:hypothetical protein